MTKDDDIVEAEFSEDEDNLPSVVDKNTQVDIEFDYARSNIINILQISNTVLENTAYLAAVADDPRMIDVYSGFIKNLTSINMSLLEIREKKMKIKGELIDEDDAPVGTTINNNAIFVGSTEELLQKLKG